ncbi:MAG: hypothetical protein E7124_06640 [Bacteroidales bacterium]|nr:hypothetical protein [Bacteroidales bacterium]
MKRLGLLLTALSAMLLSFSACQKEVEEPITVQFSAQSYQMTVGQEMDLAGELSVTGSTKAPSFSSSDASVASVGKNGKVTALKQGTVTITAKVEKEMASCQITVSAIKATKITLDAPASLPADETWATVKATVEPAGYNAEDLVWAMTPSDEGIDAVAEKVSASEYKVCFRSFVEGAKLTVKVTDKNSGLSQTADIAVTEKIVKATKITLTMPGELTEGQWAQVTAAVEPADYDASHLNWEFKPSSDALGFQSEKVSDAEYKVCFNSYAEGGKVDIIVSDGLSTVFNQGAIKVLEKPVQGVTSLSVSPASLSLNVGDEPVTLQVSYEPADYDKSLLEWSSSDDAVATVADGVVTVKAEGEAVIKVKDTVSEKEATCTVTVKTPVLEAEVKKIDVKPAILEMRVGEEAVQLIATCYDEDGNVVENYAELEWTADKMKGADDREITIVEVTQQGVVTPKNAGSTQVYVTDKKHPNVKAICNVTVRAAEIKVESVRLEPSTKTIEEGQTFSLVAFVAPENAENKTLTYASSDEKVATVTAEGVVTGVASGDATITATAANGVKGECKVTVTDEAWIELSSSEVTLKVGDEHTLTATVKPDNAPDKTVTWASSDPEVASVEGGKVKALKEGTAVITAAAANGKKAECKVNVQTAAVDFDITISIADMSIPTKGLQQDKSVRLYAAYTRKVDGKAHTPASVSWKSSDETVATVDAEGNVTAVIEHIEKSGIENGVKVTITHVADEKEKAFELTVVKALPEQVILTAVPSVDGADYKMMHGDSFTFEAKVLPEKANQDVWYAGGGHLQIANNTWTATTVGVHSFTAYASDNTSARLNFSIEVLPVPVESFTVVGESQLSLEVGDEMFLEVEILPANASYRTVTWTSSSDDIVSVASDGKITANGAGTATVTGTLKDGKTVEYTVTVSEPAASVAVGDYYYSDGTTSSELDSSKEVVGIVFSTKDPSLQDSGLSGFTNGLVVALEEASTAWQSSASNVSSWVSENVQYSDLTSTDRACGYSNTQALIAYNEANPDNKVLVVEHAPSVTLPSSTSGWYVPSYEELGQMVAAYETIKDKFTEAGGLAPDATRPSWDIGNGGSADTYRYWSSTESSGSSSWACVYQFFNGGTGYTNQLKSKGHYRVRYIFAF